MKLLVSYIGSVFTLLSDKKYGTLFWTKNFLWFLILYMLSWKEEWLLYTGTFSVKIHKKMIIIIVQSKVLFLLLFLLSLHFLHPLSVFLFVIIIVVLLSIIIVLIIICGQLWCFFPFWQLPLFQLVYLFVVWLVRQVNFPFLLDNRLVLFRPGCHSCQLEQVSVVCALLNCICHCFAVMWSLYAILIKDDSGDGDDTC